MKYGQVWRTWELQQRHEDWQGSVAAVVEAVNQYLLCCKFGMF